jgi:hypothetical protein
MSQLVYATPDNKIQSQPGINTFTILEDFYTAPDGGLILLNPLITQVSNYQPGINIPYLRPNFAGTYTLSASIEIIDAFTEVSFDIELSIILNSITVAVSRINTPESPVGDIIRTVAATFYAYPTDFISILLINHDTYPGTILTKAAQSVITFQQIY